jgi:hypothetical protein
MLATEDLAPIPLLATLPPVERSRLADGVQRGAGDLRHLDAGGGAGAGDLAGAAHRAAGVSRSGRGIAEFQVAIGNLALERMGGLQTIAAQ